MNGSDEFVREGDRLVRYERKPIIIPTDIKAIADGAFRDSDVQEVIICETVKEIGRECFCGCTKLTSVSIAASSDDSVVSISEESETVIGAYAFKDCTALKTLTLGNSVISVGEGALNGCTSLESINFHGTKQQWEDITKCENWDEKTGNFLIHCNDGNITKIPQPEPPQAPESDDENEDIITRIDMICVNGASVEEMRSAAVELQKQRGLPENKTPEKQKRLNEALGKLLKAMLPHAKPKDEPQDDMPDIIARIDRIYENGASIEEMRSAAVELQKQRGLPENKTPEKQKRLNEALGKLLKAMSRSRS